MVLAIWFCLSSCHSSQQNIRTYKNLFFKKQRSHLRNSHNYFQNFITKTSTDRLSIKFLKRMKIICNCGNFELLSHVWLFCSSMDCSPPGSSIHRIFQARIVEWVAMSFSRSIFPTQGSSPHLLYMSPAFQMDTLLLSHQGSSNIYLFGCAGSYMQHAGSLVTAHGIISWPGTEPQPPALGAWGLSH